MLLVYPASSASGIVILEQCLEKTGPTCMYTGIHVYIASLAETVHPHAMWLWLFFSPWIAHWATPFSNCPCICCQQDQEQICQYCCMWVSPTAYVPGTNHTKGHWMKMSLGSFSDDHSRVLLEETYDNPGSDYINANFISVSNTNNTSEPNPLHFIRTIVHYGSYCVHDLIFIMLLCFHWQGYKDPRAFIAAQGKPSNDCGNIKKL